MQEMLREVREVRQTPGELLRRWFISDDMDLFVWMDEGGSIAAFQLCYDQGKRGAERALSWKVGAACRHAIVDNGGNRNGQHKTTSILVSNTTFEIKRVTVLFDKQGRSLPPDIKSFVAGKIHECGLGPC